MPVTIGDLVLYNVPEISRLFKMHERTVRILIKSGKLPGRKLARRWYVPENAIKEYFKVSMSPS